MSKNILISIIIPNYNKSSFIAETLASLKKQEYIYWEAIIVDDKSTDESIKIIKKFQKKCKNIKLISLHKKQKNASVCRNIGIKEAAGEYIMFLDSDDIIMPDCLKSRLEIFSIYPINDFIVFPTGTFFKNIGDNNYVWCPKSKNFLISFLKHEITWTISSLLWKKSSLAQLNGFDESFIRLQDVDLHTRALLDTNLRFRAFPNHKIDNYYRIDENRSDIQDDKKLENLLLSTFTYITKNFSKLNHRKHKKAIKVSLFVACNAINYSAVKKQINDKTLIRFDNMTKEFINDYNQIFKNYDWQYLKFYNFIYRHGLWRVKGYNFMMRNIYYFL